ncbi:hypothetical protein PFISCL1PPCAC_18311, partial [Pristionchus fissidentatus]
FLMGTINHIPSERDFVEFKRFMIFLCPGSCQKVNLKQVYAEDDWRRTVDPEKEESMPIGGKLLPTLLAMWSTCLALICFALATMNARSKGVHLPTNRIYDLFYDTSGKETVGTGVGSKGLDGEEKSCRTAEDRSEDRHDLEDIFFDGSPYKAPPNYALHDFDQPYVDDEEMGLKTAMDDDDEEKKPLMEGVPAESQSNKQSTPGEKSIDHDSVTVAAFWREEF